MDAPSKPRDSIVFKAYFGTKVTNVWSEMKSLKVGIFTIPYNKDNNCIFSIRENETRQYLLIVNINFRSPITVDVQYPFQKGVAFSKNITEEPQKPVDGIIMVLAKARIPAGGMAIFQFIERY